jgi:hypothetical protein
MPGGIVNDVRTWLPIVNEVRTALHEEPLPIEVMKALLLLVVTDRPIAKDETARPPYLRVPEETLALYIDR